MHSLREVSSMKFPIRLFSKSSVGVDQTCKRKLFWGYEFQGGVQPKTQSLELFLGSSLHDGLAAIALDEQLALGDEAKLGIDLIANTGYQQVFRPLIEAATNPETGEIQPEDIDYAKEQATLIEGLLRGFYKHVWPKLMAEYTVYLVEQAMVYRYSNVGMMVKADLVLQSKADETLWYLEYKSTSSKKEEWTKSWETNVQLHSSIKAIEQAKGIEVSGVIVQGLYKGYESYGKLSTPMCYAYKKHGNPPFTQDQISYKYLAGWRKFPVWELEGGVKKWVDNMPDEILADQFPQTPPIFVNNELIEAFFRQQDVRQNEIVDAITMIKRSPDLAQVFMDTAFPQNFEACVPSWGRFECPYKILCHGPTIDPLKIGFVARNTTHLEPFYKVLKEQENG